MTVENIQWYNFEEHKVKLVSGFKYLKEVPHLH